MIWDSQPWRQELSTVADRLEKRQKQKRWGDRSLFLVERDIMVSAYSIRKLNDAHKISDALNATQIDVMTCKLMGRAPEQWSDQISNFDIENPSKTTITGSSDLRVGSSP